MGGKKKSLHGQCLVKEQYTEQWNDIEFKVECWTKVTKLINMYFNQQMRLIKYDKLQFMTSVKVLHSVSDCHPQGVC